MSYCWYDSQFNFLVYLEIFSQQNLPSRRSFLFIADYFSLFRIFFSLHLSLSIFDKWFWIYIYMACVLHDKEWIFREMMLKDLNEDVVFIIIIMSFDIVWNFECWNSFWWANLAIQLKIMNVSISYRNCQIVYKYWSWKISLMTME